MIFFEALVRYIRDVEYINPGQAGIYLSLPVSLSNIALVLKIKIKKVPSPS